MGVIEARKATTQAARLTRNTLTRLKAHTVWSDSDLTPEALSKKRGERAAATLADARRKAQALLKTARDGAAFARQQAELLRPKIDPDNVAQLTRSAQAWEMVIKPLREQGKNWSEIAAVVDMDGLAALDRFAEQQVRLTEAKQDVDIILSNLHGAKDKRIAEIHPDEAARTRYTEALEAEAYVGAVAQVAHGLDNANLATDVNRVMIGAIHTMHPMGVLPTEAPATAEQMDTMAAAAAAVDGSGSHEILESIPV